MWSLIRFAYLPTATLGRLWLANGATLYTIERPWNDNKPFVSCVPDGTYWLEWDTTGRIKQVPRLMDVPNRTHINIHRANYARELHGCIGVGMDWRLDPDPMVMESDRAMLLLNEYVAKEIKLQPELPDEVRELEDGQELEIALSVTSYAATSRFAGGMP